jgi:hypothetical protein
MAYQCIKYRLTQEGTIPDFLYLGEDGVGGVHVVTDPVTASPRDNVMIGITKDGATGDFEVVSSEADLVSYLTEVGANWTQPDPLQPDSTIPFDPVAAAGWVWQRLTALNNS